ncbi:carboxyl-terminal processing protease [Alkalitalea saponilacus]|uniref:Carboxyl-terminal processing protease n=2 Tax=Alkalitalea saponilacus TaxID=889453 RepID=A0A1T5HAA0_9BACT|nr:carboxyl-terminal processing protease [Alkalitalea saponilacus]
MKFRLLFIFLLPLTLLTAQRNDPAFNNIQIAWQLITNFYVDTVDSDALAREAIESMLRKLDPHSVLIPADEVKAMNEPLDGNFEGVGIEFSIMNDTLVVITPIVGGPSEEVGIRSGDRIVAIDGENVASIGLQNSDVFSMLRGQKGTRVTVSIYRKGTPGLLDFTVTRDRIPIYSLDASYMATPETGYIKLSRFAATTHEEFTKALRELKQQGMQNLILDLRGNGGGYLKAALDIADEFLDANKMLLYTEGNSVPRREHNSSRGGLWRKGELLIMIDEGSASASEIVAGAVQDWDRGVVIGRRSFGKGLVQRPFSLPDGSEIRLTIANYYTPSGRSIQKPFNNGVKEYRSEIGLRHLNGELTNGDSIQFEGEEVYRTLVSGRVVYGGGGIIPDLFVPLDTTMYSDYYRRIVASGTLNRVTMEYMDNNRRRFNDKFPDFHKFNETFVIPDELISKLIEEGENAGISHDSKGMDVSGELIKTQMKALIARDLWGTSEYYRVLNPLISVYHKAIQLIENRDLFVELLN